MAKQIDWKYLMERFASNTCTRAEFEQLLSYMESDHDAQELSEAMRKRWEEIRPEQHINAEWKERFNNLLNQASSAPDGSTTAKVMTMTWHKWAIAASVVIISAAAVIAWQWSNRATRSIAAASKEKHSIAAGRNRAILLLADGTSISLDSAHTGTIATQGGVKIIKGEEGEILYYPDRQKGVSTGYNTISTPRGGKYRVVLSDGTSVLLNAASSIRFPAGFSDATREVSLNGEAYFDVTKNATKPFHVSVGDVTVKVLGTEFNINAYKDEQQVAATLVNGAVKIAKATDTNISKSLTLKPGDQANLATGASGFTVDHSPNMDQVLAWKNGNFEFINTPVPKILREISRWYDVDVVFKGALPQKRLTGTFSRNVDIDQLVAMLKYAGVNISIDHNKLLILPK